LARYVMLFNRHDWDGLRAMLADDVRLQQSSHPPRVGRADVGTFFTLYAGIDGLWLAPARLQDREVVAVWDEPRPAKPRYLMWLEWSGDRISLIRDYRHVSYVALDAELVLAPNPQADTTPP
jgi:RNA polymerase sigma-70 factor (ECF subfamily)